MTLKTRIIPCLDVKDGRPATPAAAKPRGRASNRAAVR
jgi:imidazole glycerol phosphate synthase subunit HisF